MTVIDNQTLRTLLPHAGSMCLLRSVVDWNDERITCVATSHCAEDNPLRLDASLPVEAGIEYAAQAMAIHGALCGDGGEKGVPRLGYLAVLSRVRWAVQRLDDRAGELLVQAQKLVATADGSHYQFELRHGDELLLSGQAVIALVESSKPG